MDIPRYALIAASVLLGLMLLGEWTQVQCQAARRRITANAHGGAGFGSRHTRRRSRALRSVIELRPPVGEDVDLPSAGQLETVSTDVASASQQFITVKTDTLEIMIDLMGGDIVGAALRHYPKTLDDPSDPFVLLERNAQRTYVAQSGLVGRDGIDTGERALYRAENAFYQLTNQQPLQVALEYRDDTSGISVTKSFYFEPGSHTITVRICNPERQQRGNSTHALRATQTRQFSRTCRNGCWHGHATVLGVSHNPARPAF